MILSDNALTILERRYLVQNDDGSYEKPEDMFWRVARNIASADSLYGATDEQIDETAQEFYDVMTSLDFLPNSPCLRGAGRELQQCVACFVLPIEDDLESIFETLKTTALIHKTGGGTGFSFSRLRPKGGEVSTTGNSAGGPISFMKVFSEASREITQGGVRLGANMGILRVDHPDILDFIHCKDDGQSLTNFNISVAVTDEFMQAVENGHQYQLVNPKGDMLFGTLDARDVFDRIAKSAWKTGDPGIIFIDMINKDNSTQGEPIEATNPCGEQPLLPYESCVLGSINLANMVSGTDVNWDRLEQTARIAVRFLDNVIDVNRYPTDEIEQKTKQNRKIGLGVMGFADMLVMLGQAYDSIEAICTAENTMSYISDIAYDESANIAKEKGAYKEGEYHRNAAVTTIAPTGTLSIIADCNGGIEPFFALAYEQKTLFNADGATKTVTVINKHFERVAIENEFYSDDLMSRVAQSNSIAGFTEIPRETRCIFVTAHDIDPEWHIKMQAAFQKHTSNAISKTINMRHDATVQNVKDVYMLAWRLGCKGITIYRDGCRNVQVLNVKKKKEQQEIKPRKETLDGKTYRKTTPFGTAYVTVNQNGNGPFETFITIGKAGTDITAFAEALGRLISLVLRLPSVLSPKERMKEIVKQLLGIGGGTSVGLGKHRVLSLPDAVAQVLNESLQEDIEYKASDLCPECGQASLIFQEGCYKCTCGYSRC